MSPLILLPAEVDLVPKEERCKKNLVSHYSSSNSKVVLKLLIKVVEVHVELFAIHVRRTDFQRLIPRLFGGGRSWNKSGSKSLSIQIGLKNPLQVILDIFRYSKDNKGSGKDNKDEKVCPRGSNRLVKQLVSQLGRQKGVKEGDGGIFLAGMAVALD